MLSTAKLQAVTQTLMILSQQVEWNSACNSAYVLLTAIAAGGTPCLTKLFIKLKFDSNQFVNTRRS